MRFFILLLIILTSCSTAEDRYARLPARFSFSGTNQVPQLNAALGNPGEYCTIHQSGNYYIFSSPTGSTRTNRTALDNYQSTYLGLSGFIVGLPIIPEPGEDTQHVVCFDLACSNCYENYSIAKRMTLAEGGKAACANCHRTYDLNNQGIVIDGDKGLSLFRYRVTYIPYNLQINN